jgi:hypothetical protein
MKIPWFGHREEQERHQVYQNWAAEHPGWMYRADDDRKLYRRYKFLESLKKGFACATDVLEGKWRNYNSTAFTFRYAVFGHNGIGSELKVYYLGVILIDVPDVFFPHLSIQPAGLWHKLGWHRNPIVLQSEEVDQKCVVKTKDSQFAEDCLDETVMQYFSRSPEIGLEVNQNVLALYQPGRLQVDNIEPCLELLSHIAPLAEAASEIQRNLKQLEETDPTATESEQIAYVNVTVNPDLKRRAITALQKGSEAVIDEFVLENKYLKVVKAVIKGWLQPND